MKARWTGVFLAGALLALPLCVQAQWTGSGTAGSPYLVGSRTALDAIRNKTGQPGAPIYYSQTAHIDLAGADWTPIAQGTVAYLHYDGAGFAIRNLNVRQADSSSPNVGLFGGLEGSVRNLKLEGGRVEGQQNVGAIVGSLANGLIENCEVQVTVAGRYKVGGLVGFMSNSTIRRSLHRGASVFAVSSGFYAGGLVGEASAASRIEDSFAASPVSGPTSGGLLGYADTQTTVSRSYWDTQVSGQTASARGGSGLTTSQAMQRASFTGWDFAAVWQLYNDQSYPFLRALAPAAAAPVLSPDSDAYPGTSVPVTATCATGNATIGYSFGRTTPNESTSSRVSAGGVIEVPLGESDTILNAIAWAPYFNLSTVAIEVYRQSPPAETPVADPPADVYAGANILVTLTTASTNALIHYTLDGSEPTTSSPSVASGGVVTVPLPSLLKAKAFRVDLRPSATLEANYTEMPTVATPVFDPNGGTFTGATVNVTVTCATAGAVIHYTLDGSDPDPDDDPVVANGGSVSVTVRGTLQARAWKDGYLASDLQSATFEEAGSVERPSFSHENGPVAAGNLKVTVSCVTADASIHYTTDGSEPTQSSPRVLSGETVTVAVPGILQAKAWGDDRKPSPVKRAEYTTAGVTAKPVITPDSGTTAQLPLVVTLSSSAADAIIRYTLDGSDPTDASASLANGAPLTITEPTMLHARAYGEGLFASPLAQAYYGDFAGGSGTVEDPYLVATAAHLNNVRHQLGSHFKMIADIDLGVAPWNENEGWEPIGADYNGTYHFTGLTGTFDGGGHVVHNLFIQRPGMNEVGLFGFLDASGSIRNVGIASGSVTGQDWVGGLVGFNWGTVSTSFSGCAVAGNESVGGLVGKSDSGAVIFDSYATGAISGADKYVGGLVGFFFRDSIQRCYAVGSVSGASNVGGLIGAKGDGGVVVESFWDRHTSGLDVSSGGDGKTTPQMQQQATFTGWDFVNVWRLATNEYPRLRAFDVSASVAQPPDAWLTRFYGSVEAAPPTSVKQNTLLWEYIAGTDPTDPDSLFLVSESAISSSNLTMQVNSVTGRVYRLLSVPSLTGSPWQPVAGVDPQDGTGGPLNFDPPAPGTRTFYRVSVEMAD